MNSKLVEKIVNEFYIKIAMVLLTLFYCVPFLMNFADFLVNFVLLYSLIYVIYDLFSHRNMLKIKNGIFAILYMISFVITIIIHNFQILDLKIAVYLFMQLILLPCCSSKKTKAEIQDELHKIIDLVILVSFMFSLISLVLYFISYCKVYNTSVMDMELIVGKHPNSSLYGIMGNSNWSSFLFLTGVAFSLIKLNITAKHHHYYVSTIILCAICIFLTNSRGGLIGFSVLIVLVLFFHVWSNQNRNKKKYLLVLLLPIIMIGSLNFIKQGLNKVSNEVALCTNDFYRQQGVASCEKNSADKRDSNEKTGSTAIRLTLWKSGLKVIADYPVFGIGNAQVGQVMIQYLGNQTIIDSEPLAANTHNVYIQIALVSGLSGLVLWSIFVFSNLSSVFIQIVKKRIPNQSQKTIVILGSLVISYMIINLVEADIFISRNFMSTLYWVILGYLIRYTQLEVDIQPKKL